VAKTPLRRTGGKAPSKLTEQQARDLAAAIRAKYAPDLSAAEASPEWRTLHPQITRMILALPTWRSSTSPIFSPERAAGIARLYLVRPQLLPPMAPKNLIPEASE
jgi:hypothetical protein